MFTRSRTLVPVGLAVAAIALAGCLTTSSVPSTTTGHSDVITLIGYTRTAPDNPGGTATSVRITSEQLAHIQHAISTLSRKGAPMCMENQDLFSVTMHQSGHATLLYDASAELCPAPGVVVVDHPHASQQSYGVTCALLRLVASYLPKGTAASCWDSGS
jgi:hypothetical protein